MACSADRFYVDYGHSRLYMHIMYRGSTQTAPPSCYEVCRRHKSFNRSPPVPDRNWYCPCRGPRDLRHVTQQQPSDDGIFRSSFGDGRLFVASRSPAQRRSARGIVASARVREYRNRYSGASSATSTEWTPRRRFTRRFRITG